MRYRFKFNKTFPAYVLVFLWPFIYCYKYILTGRSFSLTIGNDFNVLYTYKLILLDKLSNFSLPLWSPSEGCGYAFYSNPFTQTFYPLNAFLVLLYKINNGYSYADNQKFTVMGLAIFAVGMLLWLRSLKVETGYAVFAVCLVTVSSKLIEILRFTNAVHTIAWVPFILFGCTIALDGSKKLKSGLIIFGSFVMMVTAGYAYYVYYSMFLVLPYVLLLVYFRQKKYCLTEYDFNIKRYITTISLSFLSAFAVCYPYLIKGKQLIDQTDHRGGSNFEYSTQHKFTFTDTIGSLIYPPAAHIEGWYYFGMISFLIVMCMYFYFIINRTQYRKQFLLLCVITLWFVIISYITYGEQSYLFKFLWQYFPGFSSLRIWGRMNIILVPVFAFLLSIGMKLFLEKIAAKKTGDAGKRSGFNYFIVSFILMYVIILSSQLYFFNNKVFDLHTLNYYKSYMSPDFNEKNFIMYSLLSFLTLVIFIFTGRNAGFINSSVNRKRFGLIFFICVFVICASDLYHAGSEQWAEYRSPDTGRKKVMMDELDLISLSTPRVSKNAMITIAPAFSAGYVDEWYYERYVKFFKKYENGDDDTNEDSFNELLGLNNGKRIFCSYGIENKSINQFIEDSGEYEKSQLANIKIEKYDGDELICTVDTKEKGYCSFIDNWDPDWKATVNGKDAEIELLFGTFKSVKIEKGINIVKYKYSPKIF